MLRFRSTTTSTSTTSTTSPSRRRARLAVLGALLSLNAGAVAAQADVAGPWQGTFGQTITQCSSSTGSQGPNYTSSFSFNAHSVIHQAVEGQRVAVRTAVRDSRGWHFYNWSSSTQTAFGSDGVRFNHTYYDLTGRVAYMWIQYAWMSTRGWIYRSEILRDYMTQFGTHETYCPI